MPWTVDVPPQYQQIIVTASQRTGVPANILAMILAHESGWNPGAVGDHGTSFGLAQIHTPAHPNVSRQQAMDPNFAINWTADELRNIWAQTHDSAATIIYHNAPAAAIHYARTGQFGPTPGLAQAAHTYLSAVTAPLGGMKGITKMGSHAPAGLAQVPPTEAAAHGLPQTTAADGQPYDLRSEFLKAMMEPAPSESPTTPTQEGAASSTETPPEQQPEQPVGTEPPTSVNNRRTFE